MSQHDLNDTSIKCHVCNGAGHELRIVGYEVIERQCKACNGTGLSVIGRAMNDLQSVFTCEKCGANKVHYRLYGYRCPNRCEDEL